jgi:hypothetical protein
MTRFSSRTTAEAVVAASREAIWEVLVDPAMVARLTPFLQQITADGDLWRWEMSGLDVLGLKVAPAFTERMVFDDLHRIDFHHEPPEGTRERSGVAGWYRMTDAEGGTHLATSLEVSLDLPLPRVSSPAVTSTMKGVMFTVGDRFSKNLLEHLGVP